MTAGHHHHAAPEPVVESAPVPAWRLLATLAIAGSLAGLLVVGVYRFTLPAIQRYAGERIDGAVREVLKAPARWDTLYLVADKLKRTAPAGVDPRELPKAFVGLDASGKPVGVAVTAEAPGFQEVMSLMVGFDPATGELTGIKILEQKETPGLGDKIENDTAFGKQFPGRVAPVHGVKGAAGSDRGAVQTITGATISSRAVIRIVNGAVARWRPLLQAFDAGAQ